MTSKNSKMRKLFCKIPIKVYVMLEIRFSYKMISNKLFKHNFSGLGTQTNFKISFL